MIDPFLILAPVLLLAVIALLGFVGCKVFGESPSAVAPTPKITSVSPDTVTVGGGTFPLTVKGTGFVNDPDTQSIVQWNGVDKVSFFPTADLSTLTAFIPREDIANAGTANVAVKNENVDTTGLTSDPVTVNINSPAPPPVEITVTFGTDALGGPPPGAPGSPLNGVYKNLNFGNGAWFWVDPALGMGPANAININSGPNPGSGDISFANGPRLLLRIRVFPKRVGPDGISCHVAIIDSGSPPRNPQVTVAYKAADLNMVHFIPTAWAFPTQRFTIQADIGFDLDIDTIVYQGPA